MLKIFKINGFLKNKKFIQSKGELASADSKNIFLL